ncbi:MFS transporter small subunit [Streptomyces olivoreticuli]
MTPARKALLVSAWLWVGAPFAYGVYELTLKLRQLFTG